MPRKTIVLTFDDAVANHATFVATLLRQYRFNATFYVCEFPPDFAKPDTFAYPGGGSNDQAMRVVAEYGFTRARGAESRPYVPSRDNPMCIPSFPVHGDDPKVFYSAVAQAADEAIPVLMFHGVPEYTHPWVNTSPERFAEYMRFLADESFNVIALRELPVTPA